MLDAALRSLLERTPVAALSTALRARGLPSTIIDGVHPLVPGTTMVGTARTLRFIPVREDLLAAHGGGHNAQKQVFDTVEPGEVIVIEARGDRTAGTLGDILALRALVRGAAGVVTDGAVRDAAAVAAVGLPVFAAGTHPAVLGRRHVPWESGVTIACGGAAVQPGDVIVGDGDGLVVIPAAVAADVARAAADQEQRDAWIAARIAEGHPVAGLFPLSGDWQRRFDEEAQR